ncbi:MAG: zinc ribbon domain-containing protein, partial [Aeromicrobium sp.]
LSSMQHEIVALDRRIATLEDEELEVMEALEEAQSKLTAVTAELAEINTALEEATAARDAKVRAIDEEARGVLAEREMIAQKVPDELTVLYDKIRKQSGGMGAAALRARRCEGCRLEINGADLRELVALPDDEVLRCPECSRILVRTLESGV